MTIAVFGINKHSTPPSLFPFPPKKNRKSELGSLILHEKNWKKKHIPTIRNEILMQS